MVEHARRDLRHWKAFLAEHYRKQVEIDMTPEHDWKTSPCDDEECSMLQCIAKRMSLRPTDYERDFDKAAADTSTPWLPSAPVKDAETSETRGVVEDTLTERGKNYGDFTDNADYAQRIKQALYESRNWHSMPTYMQEALDLIASKIGRMLSGDPFYVDNWHDIGGYTTLVEQRIKQRSTK